MREEQWSSHSSWLGLITLFVFTRWTGNKSTTTAYAADHVCFIVRWLRRKFRHERVGQRIVLFFQGNSTVTKNSSKAGSLKLFFLSTVQTNIAEESSYPLWVRTLYCFANWIGWTRVQYLLLCPTNIYQNIRQAIFRSPYLLFQFPHV